MKFIRLIRLDCDEAGHQWIHRGGRSCPHGIEDCSQKVFICRSCMAQDCGEEGGPAWLECSKCGVKEKKKEQERKKNEQEKMLYSRCVTSNYVQSGNSYYYVFVNDNTTAASGNCYYRILQGMNPMVD